LCGHAVDVAGEVIKGEGMDEPTRAKFKAAEMATTSVFRHIRVADEWLLQIHNNAAGVLMPGARGALAVAVDELQKALAIVDRTEWPTDGDYGQL
jgi:hypothetical protein